MNADERGLSNRAVHVAGILRGVAEETIDGMDRMTWRAALLAAARIIEEDDNRRTAEGPAPTDAREALAEALAVVSELADEHTELLSDFEDGFPAEGAREALRIIRAALSPTSPDAGQRDTQERAACTWDKCRSPRTGKCFAWCRCVCHDWTAERARADREAQP